MSEALIKMAALGSSLEETELCLQQKEELLSKMEREYPGLVESRKAGTGASGKTGGCRGSDF